MKISNDVVDELKKIRNAVDDMYDEVNVTLFEKKYRLPKCGTGCSLLELGAPVMSTSAL